MDATQDGALEVTTRRHHVAWLAVILVAAAVVRLALPWGYEDPDALFYASHARMLAEGDPRFASKVLESLQPGAPDFPALAANVRLGISGPIAVLFRILGESREAALAWIFAGSLLHVLVAYLLGRRLWSPAVGLVAAAIVASVPLEVAMATHVEPDVLSAAFAGLAYFVLLGAETRKGSRAVALGALAGLLLGVAFLCKESIVLALPVLALHAAWRWKEERRIPLAHVGFAAGALALPVAEMALYAAIVGDPLFRLNLLEVAHNQSPHWSWREYAAQHPNHPVLRRLLLDLPKLLVRPADFGLLAPAALVALPCVFRRAGRSDRLVVTWLLGILAVLAFGTTSLRGYAPIYLGARYYLLLVLPASLLVARACSLLAEREWTPVARRRALVVSSVVEVACIAAGLALIAGLFWEPARAAYEHLRAGGRFEQPFEFHRATIERLSSAAKAALGGIALVAIVMGLRIHRRGLDATGRAIALGLACALVIAQLALAAGFLREHGTRERAVNAAIEASGLSGLPVRSDWWTLGALCWYRDFDSTGLRSWKRAPPVPGENAVVLISTRYLRPQPPPDWAVDGTVPLRLVTEVRVPDQPATKVFVTDWGVAPAAKLPLP